MEVIRNVLTKVMPALFGCLGIFQIIMKGEYKKEDSEKKEDTEKKEDSKKKESSEEGKNEALIREYAKALVEFSIKANKKNTHQDGTSKSRGYMSGRDVSWVGRDSNEELNNWYKQMGLMERRKLLKP